MVETAFVLLAMTCSGHTNATCWFRATEYESREACVAEMARIDTFEKAMWMGEGKRAMYDPKRTMCISSDVVAFLPGIEGGR